MGRLLEDGDELALQWDELADGRVWQLVRGRDFFCNPREVEEAAGNAAARLEKAVQTLSTLHASIASVWVQFADHRIEAGEPCPCGSVVLRRVNDGYAICAECEATLLVNTKQKAAAAGSPSDNGDGGPEAATRLRIFVPEGGRAGAERKRLAALRRVGPDGEPRDKEAAKRKREEKQIRRETGREAKQQRRLRREDAQPGARKRRFRRARPEQGSADTLDRFTDVQLWARESGRPGRYWGYGFDQRGRFALLEVTLELGPDGAPVEDPGHPGRALHSVGAVRSDPDFPVIDANALLAKPDGKSPAEVLSLGAA